MSPAGISAGSNVTTSWICFIPHYKVHQYRVDHSIQVNLEAAAAGRGDTEIIDLKRLYQGN